MDQVEEVKNKLGIVEVISRYVNLKRGGKNMKGLCPFHGEKTPSFMVNPELQIFKCFGCQKSGDVITFVQEIEGLEFVEALRMLAEQVGVKLVFKGEEKRTEREEMEVIQELAAEYYHYLLTKHAVGAAARAYLKERKIGEKIIEQFKLGYALPAWDGLYQFLVVKKKKDLLLVEKTGLILRSNRDSRRFYDRFRKRVIFPLMDHRGRVVGFAGRVLPGEDKEEPKYINSPESLTYHKSEMLYGLTQARKAIREKDRVVVVEGEVDMISSFAAGVGETVAIKGSALTEQQIERLRRLTSNLVLALDADEAGSAATKRAIEVAEGKGMGIKVVRILGGKDPDEIARENPNEWKQMLEKAVDVYQFYLETAVSKYDPRVVEGKRKITEEVIPILGRIGNRVVQEFYIRKLAEVLGVSVEAIWKELERVGKGERLVLGKEERMEKKIKTREELLLAEILGLGLVVGREKAGELTKSLWESGEEVAEVKILGLYVKGNKEGGEFVRRLPEELKMVAQEAYMQEWDEEKAEKNLRQAVKEWQQWRMRKRRDELSKLIARAEEGDKEVGTRDLQEEFMRLTRKLNEDRML